MFRAEQGTMANIPSTANGLTATAGGTKAAALPLTAAVNRISVCATAADSVLLMPAKLGLTILLINDGAASMQVFGQGTDTIDEVATGTGVAVANGKRRILACYADGKWSSVLGA